MYKIKFMRKIFFIISLTISILTTTSYNSSAQESDNYQSLINMGDKEFNNEQYVKAKSYYQEALRLNKDDATAKNKLNKTLQKIREQSEKEVIFYQYIDEADEHFDNGEYEDALSMYNKAKKVLPKDEYVNEQISTTMQIINDEKDKIATFNQIIKTAEEFMAAQKYTEAVLQYKAALELYPNNETTKSKYEIAKTNKENYDKQNSNFERLKKEGKEFTLRKKYNEAIAKYEEALAIFPNDSDLAEHISSLKTTKEIYEKYDSAISRADSLYLEKSYEKAKAAYSDALAVIPDDSYSADMISRIEETMNSSEYQALTKYLNIIEEAKALENGNNLNAALDKYKSALSANPGDEFATQKIEQITKLIDAKNNEIALNAQYENLIKNGDNDANKDDFHSALDYYSQAYNLIPSRPEAKEKKEFAQKRIDEIEAQLALEKEKWDEYYKSAMNDAKSYMSAKNYPEAIKEYNKALRYKENDSAATQGLNNATRLNDARIEASLTEYNQYIANGDIQFNAKNYEKAIDFYTKANALNTGKTYPVEMINRIFSILDENTLEKLVSSNTTISSGESKKFTFNPIDMKLRKGNYVVLKAKNLSDKSHTIFLSYGNKDGNNGRLTIKMHNNQDVNNYIVKIGSQQKWFTYDNTWIEVSAENGSIEIELLEITKGN